MISIYPLFFKLMYSIPSATLRLQHQKCYTVKPVYDDTVYNDKLAYNNNLFSLIFNKFDMLSVYDKCIPFLKNLCTVYLLLLLRLQHQKYIRITKNSL